MSMIALGKTGSATGLMVDDAAADNDLLSMTQERAEVLDHNARLYFDLDPNGQGTNLYSFYSEYTDYLDERNLIDVSKFIISEDCILCHYAFESILTDLCINFSLINIKRRKREPRLLRRTLKRPRKRRRKKRPSRLKRMVCPRRAEQQVMELLLEE